MNWFNKEYNEKIVFKKTFYFGSGCPKKADILKLSYKNQSHRTDFSVQDDSDGYYCQIQATESKNKITLVARFLSDVYGYPLFEDMWHYKTGQGKRAFKTFNRLINVIEDLKIEMEDDEIPGPTLQSKAREELRYVDIEHKVDTHNRSLEAAKFLNGESDWRGSLYGSRYPEREISISNYGTLNIKK